jgi:hypothetical protein
VKKFIIGLLLCAGAIPSLMEAAPDCQKNYRFSNRTGDGRINPDQEFTSVIGGGAISGTYDNRTSACNAWLITYDSEGFSGLSLTFQDAPTANGTVGSFVTFGGTTVSGSNPMSSTTGALFTGTGYYPYLNIMLVSAVGTGSINVTLYGWKSPNYIVSLGGGTGGTYTPGTCQITATGAAITVDQNTCTNGATNGTATAVGSAPFRQFELNGNNQSAITVTAANWTQGNPSFKVTNGGSTITTWAWPVNFIPTPFIYPVTGANSATPIQPGYYDGTTYYLFQGPNPSGISIGAAVGVPSCTAGTVPPAGTYPSGAYYLWNDLTDLVPHVMDVATCARGTYAKVLAPTSGTFLTGIGNSGTFTTQVFTPGVIDLLTQGAVLTSQAFFTPTASGFYEVRFYSKVTQAATASSILGAGTNNGLTIAYTNPTDSTVNNMTIPEYLPTSVQAAAGSGAAGNTTATALQGAAMLFLKTGVATTFSYGYTSVGATPMQYELHIRASGPL